MKLSGGTIDLGNRSIPSADAQKRWTSVGVSMARDVVRADFSGTEQDITLTFLNKDASLKDSVDAYLNGTIKNMGLVSVTLDSGDDLGVAALGTSGGEITTLLYYVSDSFNATWRVGTKWDISFTLRYYS